MRYTTPGGVVVTDRRHDRTDHEGAPPAIGPDIDMSGAVVGPARMWPAQPWAGWPDDWATPPMGPGWEDWSGYGAGRQAAPWWTRVSTAFTCVDLNSRQLGSFPVYGMTGDAPFVLPEWSVSPEPELWESWAQFVQCATNSLLLRGEAITIVTGRNRDGTIARFTLLNPDTVDVELIDGRRVVTMAGGEELPREDVLIVRYQTIPGRLRGLGPLEWAGQSMLTSASLERYAAQVASRGGIPWGILRSQANINARQAEESQARWVAAAARRDGAPAVLGNGWELQSLSISPKDMALLELREFDERRICAAFGVPAYLANVEMTSGLTYANASLLRDQHWAATLRTIAGLLCAAWGGWLLPRGERMEMNPDRYVQPAFADRAQAWSVMHSIHDEATGKRAMTIDEIRAAERLPPDTATPATPVAGTQTLTGAQV